LWKSKRKNAKKNEIHEKQLSTSTYNFYPVNTKKKYKNNTSIHGKQQTHQQPQQQPQNTPTTTTTTTRTTKHKRLLKNNNKTINTKNKELKNTGYRTNDNNSFTATTKISNTLNSITTTTNTKKHCVL